MIFISTNIFRPDDRKIVSQESYDNIFDFLEVHYPEGFDTPVDISVNTKELDFAQYNKPLKEGDIVVLLERPGFTAIAGSTVLAFIANMAISIAISYVIGRIFAPSALNGQRIGGSDSLNSSVYSLNAQQNKSKAGEIIPINYGRFRMYPSLIAPPYYRYENNQEYLYQLMCIGQGRYDIEKMMISDTDVSTIAADSFVYKKLEYSDFSAVGGIKNAVGDIHYQELVKTLPDVSDLQIYGTPGDGNYAVSFSGSVISFPVGTKLDGLNKGATITISNSLHNDGTYDVVSVLDEKVTVAQSLTLEPTEIVNLGAFSPSYVLHFEKNSIFWTDGNNKAIPLPLTLSVGNTYSFDGNLNANKGVSNIVKGNYCNFFAICFNDYFINESISSGTVNATKLTTIVNINFTSTYGPYVFENVDAHEILGVEIDYYFAAGIYNSNNQGNMLGLTVNWDYTIDIDGSSTQYNQSSYGKNREVIRKTSVTMFNQAVSPAKISISLKKDVEHWSTKISDDMSIKSIKIILAPPNNEPLKDITLLWCRLKATNAISAINQQSINGWFVRNDVGSDLASVLSDIYTNDTYGARLNSGDLDFVATPEKVNGSIEESMTVYDAMKMVSKAQKYTLYPAGKDLLLKLDDKINVITALYNETNILEGSLKISYFFKEENKQNDSVKCSYRSSVDWKPKEVTYPPTGLFPNSFELFGVTDDIQALKMATYYHNQGLYRRKIISFSTDIQGLVPQFLDKILISHNMLQWGTAGQVMRIYGVSIELSEPILDTSTKTITFRKDDGAVSDTLPIVILDDMNIDVANVPSWVTDDTFYTIGVAKEYLVTAIKPNGDSVGIECVEYDERTYE